MDRNDLIPIGTLAKRTGLAVSAIRFYESKGLLTSLRTAGNQRRFLIAQRLGLGLMEIEQALATLPQGRTPTLTDWQRISRSLRGELDARINLLTRTRSKLDECIGCGCLSLDRCQLYNKHDRAGGAGAGPRFVLD
jgi:MerR family redox-sensitive transcriptional activator SoxR